jgi:N-methylhydantoinase A
MRFAVDTGGTFTDLIVEDNDGGLHMYKAATTPDDPIRGVINSLENAAAGLNTNLASLVRQGELFIHGTTHAINAIVTGNTAKTAFLTTEGHRDILVFREGGRMEPFNFTVPFPQPYVPRALTFEVPGRILADGTEMTPFDEASVLGTIEELKNHQVEAVAVCLLWSIVNPAHEDRVGELLAEHLPGVPYTLSHVLNPSLREYRRASSAAIDASLKPLMSAYMHNLSGRLREAGFGGRVLIVTSQAGVMDADDIAETPIHLINSGPSMAPVSGRYFARVDEASDSAVIADTGGTTYDVSLVRRGRIPWTRETWIGEPYRGHMTGFPSVDVKSIGAGGGSIAWVDEGGMLHVGPQSAGAVPGPACYGQGGDKPTVTDAALVLGYLDPEFFLGGAMALDVDAARQALDGDASDHGHHGQSGNRPARGDADRRRRRGRPQLDRHRPASRLSARDHSRSGRGVERGRRDDVGSDLAVPAHPVYDVGSVRSGRRQPAARSARGKLPEFHRRPGCRGARNQHRIFRRGALPRAGLGDRSADRQPAF